MTNREWREFLDSRLTSLEERIKARLAALETKMAVWLVSTVIVGTLVNHWWR